MRDPQREPRPFWKEWKNGSQKAKMTLRDELRSFCSRRTHHRVPDTSPEWLLLSLPVSTSDHEESGSDDGLADTGRTRSKSALLSTRRRRSERKRKAHPRKVRQRAKSVKFFPREVTARTIPQRTTCQKKKEKDEVESVWNFNVGRTRPLEDSPWWERIG